MVGGIVGLYVADADIIQELMTTKNNSIDKDGQIEAVFAPLIGYALLFSKATKSWSLKRKHCAQAFYRTNMEQM